MDSEADDDEEINFSKITSWRTQNRLFAGDNDRKRQNSTPNLSHEKNSSTSLDVVSGGESLSTWSESRQQLSKLLGSQSVKLSSRENISPNKSRKLDQNHIIGANRSAKEPIDAKNGSRGSTILIRDNLDHPITKASSCSDFFSSLVNSIMKMVSMEDIMKYLRHQREIFEGYGLHSLSFWQRSSSEDYVLTREDGCRIALSSRDLYMFIDNLCPRDQFFSVSIYPEDRDWNQGVHAINSTFVTKLNPDKVSNLSQTVMWKTIHIVSVLGESGEGSFLRGLLLAAEPLSDNKLHFSQSSRMAKSSDTRSIFLQQCLNQLALSISQKLDKLELSKLLAEQSLSMESEKLKSLQLDNLKCRLSSQREVSVEDIAVQACRLVKSQSLSSFVWYFQGATLGDKFQLSTSFAIYKESCRIERLSSSLLLDQSPILSRLFGDHSKSPSSQSVAYLTLVKEKWIPTGFESTLFDESSTYVLLSIPILQDYHSFSSVMVMALPESAAVSSLLHSLELYLASILILLQQKIDDNHDSMKQRFQRFALSCHDTFNNFGLKLNEQCPDARSARYFLGKALQDHQDSWSNILGVSQLTCLMPSTFVSLESSVRANEWVDVGQLHGRSIMSSMKISESGGTDAKMSWCDKLLNRSYYSITRREVEQAMERNTQDLEMESFDQDILWKDVLSMGSWFHQYSSTYVSVTFLVLGSRDGNSHSIGAEDEPMIWVFWKGSEHFSFLESSLLSVEILSTIQQELGSIGRHFHQIQRMDSLSIRQQRDQRILNTFSLTLQSMRKKALSHKCFARWKSSFLQLAQSHAIEQQAQLTRFTHKFLQFQITSKLESTNIAAVEKSRNLKFLEQQLSLLFPRDTIVYACNGNSLLESMEMLSISRRDSVVLGNSFDCNDDDFELEFFDESVRSSSDLEMKNSYSSCSTGHFPAVPLSLDFSLECFASLPDLKVAPKYHLLGVVKTLASKRHTRSASPIMNTSSSSSSTVAYPSFESRITASNPNVLAIFRVVRLVPFTREEVQCFQRFFMTANLILSLDHQGWDSKGKISSDKLVGSLRKLVPLFLERIPHSVNEFSQSFTPFVELMKELTSSDLSMLRLFPTILDNGSEISFFSSMAADMQPENPLTSFATIQDIVESRLRIETPKTMTQVSGRKDLRNAHSSDTDCIFTTRFHEKDTMLGEMKIMGKWKWEDLDEGATEAIELVMYLFSASISLFRRFQLISSQKQIIQDLETKCMQLEKTIHGDQIALESFRQRMTHLLSLFVFLSRSNETSSLSQQAKLIAELFPSCLQVSSVALLLQYPVSGVFDPSFSASTTAATVASSSSSSSSSFFTTSELEMGYRVVLPSVNQEKEMIALDYRTLKFLSFHQLSEIPSYFDNAFASSSKIDFALFKGRLKGCLLVFQDTVNNPNTTSSTLSFPATKIGESTPMAVSGISSSSSTTTNHSSTNSSSNNNHHKIQQWRGLEDILLSSIQLAVEKVIEQEATRNAQDLLSQHRRLQDDQQREILGLQQAKDQKQHQMLQMEDNHQAVLTKLKEREAFHQQKLSEMQKEVEKMEEIQMKKSMEMESLTTSLTQKDLECHELQTNFEEYRQRYEELQNLIQDYSWKCHSSCGASSAMREWLQQIVGTKKWRVSILDRQRGVLVAPPGIRGLLSTCEEVVRLGKAKEVFTFASSVYGDNSITQPLQQQQGWDEDRETDYSRSLRQSNRLYDSNSHHTGPRISSFNRTSNSIFSTATNTPSSSSSTSQELDTTTMMMDSHAFVWCVANPLLLSSLGKDAKNVCFLFYKEVEKKAEGGFAPLEKIFLQSLVDLVAPSLTEMDGNHDCGGESKFSQELDNQHSWLNKVLRIAKSNFWNSQKLWQIEDFHSQEFRREVESQIKSMLMSGRPSGSEVVVDVDVSFLLLPSLLKKNNSLTTSQLQLLIPEATLLPQTDIEMILQSSIRGKVTRKGSVVYAPVRDSQGILAFLRVEKRFFDTVSVDGAAKSTLDRQYRKEETSEDHWKMLFFSDIELELIELFALALWPSLEKMKVFREAQEGVIQASQALLSLQQTQTSTESKLATAIAHCLEYEESIRVTGMLLGIMKSGRGRQSHLLDVAHSQLLSVTSSEVCYVILPNEDSIFPWMKDQSSLGNGNESTPSKYFTLEADTSNPLPVILEENDIEGLAIRMKKSLVHCPEDHVIDTTYAMGQPSWAIRRCSIKGETRQRSLSPWNVLVVPFGIESTMGCIVIMRHSAVYTTTDKECLIGISKTLSYCLTASLRSEWSLHDNRNVVDGARSSNQSHSLSDDMTSWSEFHEQLNEVCDMLEGNSLVYSNSNRNEYQDSISADMDDSSVSSSKIQYGLLFFLLRQIFPRTDIEDITELENIVPPSYLTSSRSRYGISSTRLIESTESKGSHSQSGATISFKNRSTPELNSDEVVLQSFDRSVKITYWIDASDSTSHILAIIQAKVTSKISINCLKREYYYHNPSLLRLRFGILLSSMTHNAFLHSSLYSLQKNLSKTKREAISKYEEYGREMESQVHVMDELIQRHNLELEATRQEWDKQQIGKEKALEFLTTVLLASLSTSSSHQEMKNFSRLLLAEIKQFCQQITVLSGVQSRYGSIWRHSLQENDERSSDQDVLEVLWSTKENEKLSIYRRHPLQQAWASKNIIVVTRDKRVGNPSFDTEHGDSLSPLLNIVGIEDAIEWANYSLGSMVVVIRDEQDHILTGSKEYIGVALHLTFPTLSVELVQSLRLSLMLLLQKLDWLKSLQQAKVEISSQRSLVARSQKHMEKQRISTLFQKWKALISQERVVKLNSEVTNLRTSIEGLSFLEKSSIGWTEIMKGLNWATTSVSMGLMELWPYASWSLMNIISSTISTDCCSLLILQDNGKVVELSSPSEYGGWMSGKAMSQRLSTNQEDSNTSHLTINTIPPNASHVRLLADVDEDLNNLAMEIFTHHFNKKLWTIATKPSSSYSHSQRQKSTLRESIRDEYSDRRRYGKSWLVPIHTSKSDVVAIIRIGVLEDSYSDNLGEKTRMDATALGSWIPETHEDWNESPNPTSLPSKESIMSGQQLVLQFAEGIAPLLQMAQRMDSLNGLLDNSEKLKNGLQHEKQMLQQKQELQESVVFMIKKMLHVLYVQQGNDRRASTSSPLPRVATIEDREQLIHEAVQLLCRNLSEGLSQEWEIETQITWKKASSLSGPVIDSLFSRYDSQEMFHSGSPSGDRDIHTNQPRNTKLDFRELQDTSNIHVSTSKIFEDVSHAASSSPLQSLVSHSIPLKSRAGELILQINNDGNPSYIATERGLGPTNIHPILDQVIQFSSSMLAMFVESQMACYSIMYQVTEAVESLKEISEKNENQTQLLEMSQYRLTKMQEDQTAQRLFLDLYSSGLSNLISSSKEDNGTMSLSHANASSAADLGNATAWENRAGLESFFMQCCRWVTSFYQGKLVCSIGMVQDNKEGSQVPCWSWYSSLEGDRLWKNETIGKKAEELCKDLAISCLSKEQRSRIDANLIPEVQTHSNRISEDLNVSLVTSISLRIYSFPILSPCKLRGVFQLIEQQSGGNNPDDVNKFGQQLAQILAVLLSSYHRHVETSQRMSSMSQEVVLAESKLDQENTLYHHALFEAFIWKTLSTFSMMLARASVNGTSMEVFLRQSETRELLQAVGIHAELSWIENRDSSNPQTFNPSLTSLSNGVEIPQLSVVIKDERLAMKRLVATFQMLSLNSNTFHASSNSAVTISSPFDLSVVESSFRTKCLLEGLESLATLLQGFISMNLTNQQQTKEATKWHENVKKKYELAKDEIQRLKSKAQHHEKELEQSQLEFRKYLTLLEEGAHQVYELSSGISPISSSTSSSSNAIDISRKESTFFWKSFPRILSSVIASMNNIMEGDQLWTSVLIPSNSSKTSTSSTIPDDQRSCQFDIYDTTTLSNGQPLNLTVPVFLANSTFHGKIKQSSFAMKSSSVVYSCMQQQLSIFNQPLSNAFDIIGLSADLIQHLKSQASSSSTEEEDRKSDELTTLLISCIPIQIFDKRSNESSLFGIARVIHHRPGLRNLSDKGSGTSMVGKSVSFYDDKEKSQGLITASNSLPMPSHIRQPWMAVGEFLCRLVGICFQSSEREGKIGRELIQSNQRLQESEEQSNKASHALNRYKRLYKVIGREALLLMDPLVSKSKSSSSSSNGSGTTNKAQHPCYLSPYSAFQDTCMKILSLVRTLLRTEGQAILVRDPSASTTSSSAYQIIYTGNCLHWKDIEAGTFGIVSMKASSSSSSSLVESCIQVRKTIVVDNGVNDERYNPLIDGKSEIGCPYLVTPLRGQGGSVIGVVLGVRSFEASKFSGEDVVACELAVGQGSLSLFWCQGIGSLHHKLSKTASKVEQLEKSFSNMGKGDQST